MCCKVELDEALREEEHAILLEEGEIRFKSRNTPDLRTVAERVAIIEDEASCSRSN